jgi:uncharacterized protein YbjT (DUF2867 family)
MNILLFGATGMVGQGVLRECLLADDVETVVTLGRTPTGIPNPRLREIVRADLFDYAPIESQLTGFDACFFCLGVASPGMTEADYTRLTYNLTVAAASVLARLNPQMTFINVSGAGTDSSESGRLMWARVKGRTESALRRLPFKAVFALRPGLILPVHGEQSKVGSYRVFYRLAGPLLGASRRLFPSRILTTEVIGRAMLQLARHGGPNNILEAQDIYRAAMPDAARSPR